MVYQYKGHFPYNDETVRGWTSSAIGIYYCGYLNSTGHLVPIYIGKGTGTGGMRERLLCHLRDDLWPEVTHFGYSLCDFPNEADTYEIGEIQKHQPARNVLGRR